VCNIVICIGPYTCNKIVRVDHRMFVTGANYRNHGEQTTVLVRFFRLPILILFINRCNCVPLPNLSHKKRAPWIRSPLFNPKPLKDQIINWFLMLQVFVAIIYLTVIEKMSLQWQLDFQYPFHKLPTSQPIPAYLLHLVWVRLQ